DDVKAPDHVSRNHPLRRAASRLVRGAPTTGCADASGRTAVQGGREGFRLRTAIGGCRVLPAPVASERILPSSHTAMSHYLRLALALLALPPAAAQDWTTIVLGTTVDLHAVHHQGGGHAGPGYVVGDGGFVASSPDNLIWTPVSVGTSAGLRSIIQPSGGQAWVSGVGGTVRVRDTAGTWHVRDIPSTEDYVLSTQSSGQAIAHGTGGSIWKSDDLGESWTLQHSAGVPLHAGYRGTFEPGFSVGDDGTILKTTDRGETWTPRPSGTTADLYGIFEGGEATLYVVGEGGTILVSTDNGETWSPRLSGTSRTLRAVHAWGSSRVVAVGDDGTMVRS